MNAEADIDPEIIRISMDTKATVDVGDYFRYGRSRGLEPVKALDHDVRLKEKLVPGGILEPVSGRSFIFFTGSNKISDFIVDSMPILLSESKYKYIRQLKRASYSNRQDVFEACDIGNRNPAGHRIICDQSGNRVKFRIRRGDGHF